jgi:hypothetical protein
MHGDRLRQCICSAIVWIVFAVEASGEEPATDQPASVAVEDASAPTPDFFDRLRDRSRVTGTLEIESGIELDGDVQKVEALLQPVFEFTFPRDLELTIIPRLRFDPADHLAPGQPSQDSRSEYNRSLFIGDAIELELRETYIETAIGETFLTIGKQQVVWGKADGLKVLDVVNPQDFREFILDDFDDSRIPLWTVKADIPIKNTTLQLLWIPDRTYHEFPEPGATYELVSTVPEAPPGAAVIVNDEDRPDNFLTGSDVGARLSAMWGGWDVTFNYLYAYDDTPALYRTIAVGPGGTTITVNPEYERMHVAGGSFSNAFGDLTLRGELAGKFDKFYPTEDPLDADGVEQTNEIEYVLGLDWFGISETFLSFQFFQSILTEDAPGLLRDQVENTFTVFIQRDLLNDALQLSNIWIHSINHGDGLVRPTIEYEVSSNLRVSAGFDIFYGESSGIFGQFHDATRIVAGFEWSF